MRKIHVNLLCARILRKSRVQENFTVSLCIKFMSIFHVLVASAAEC